eukprot:SAG22_NODE_98_length_20720_cov_17.226662_19_plen_140_part_00
MEGSSAAGWDSRWRSHWRSSCWRILEARRDAFLDDWRLREGGPLYWIPLVQLSLLNSNMSIRITKKQYDGLSWNHLIQTGTFNQKKQHYPKASAHKLKSKPMTLDRVKDMPGAIAAFGKGFIGRAPNNNVSNSGDSQMT